MQGGQHPGMGERLAVVEHVGDREQGPAGRGHHLVAGQGVEPAALDVEAALGEPGEVDLGVVLGGVVLREVVGLEGPVEDPVGVVELGVVAEEVVEPEAEVDLVVLLEGLLEDQVVLVPHPLVGQVVRVDAEVLAVLGPAVGVAGEAVLDPAVDLDLGVVGHARGASSAAWSRRPWPAAAGSSAATAASVGSPPPPSRSALGRLRSLLVASVAALARAGLAAGSAGSAGSGRRPPGPGPGGRPGRRRGRRRPGPDARPGEARGADVAHLGLGEPAHAEDQRGEARRGPDLTSAVHPERLLSVSCHSTKATADSPSPRPSGRPALDASSPDGISSPGTHLSSGTRTV